MQGKDLYPLNRFELTEEMQEYFCDAEWLLQEVISAMSDDEAREIFAFIAQNHDIPLLDQEDNTQMKGL